MSSKRFDMSPTEFLNSDYLKNLKQKFINNEFDTTCVSCKKLEDSGVQSFRQFMLNVYGEDVTTDTIDYMELRTSNLCNFQCIMCNAQNSSLIAGEVFNIKENDWEEILVLSESLKYLILTGGEPMLIKHYYQLLDHLVSKNKTDMELRIYTNASVYNPVFIEKILKFNTVLNLSIDGVGETAVKQRQGTDWQAVDDNIHKFLTLPVSVKFHSTFTNISIIDVHSLAKYFVKVSKKNPNLGFSSHIVTLPNQLSVFNILPSDLPIALASIEEALSILEGEQFNQLRFRLTTYKAMLAKKLKELL